MLRLNLLDLRLKPRSVAQAAVTRYGDGVSNSFLEERTGAIKWSKLAMIDEARRPPVKLPPSVRRFRLHASVAMAYACLRGHAINALIISS